MAAFVPTHSRTASAPYPSVRSRSALIASSPRTLMIWVGTPLAGELVPVLVRAGEHNDALSAEHLGRQDARKADCAIADHGNGSALLDVGADGGVIAGAHDVGEGEQRGHGLVREATAGYRHEGAVGLRYSDVLGLAAVAVDAAGKKPPWMQAVWKPLSQFLQTPSLQANGEMTKSPTSTVVTSGPIPIDDANELMADRSDRMIRLTTVIPQVGAAHAGQHDPHDSVGELVDGRLGPLLDGDDALPLEDCCFDDAFFFNWARLVPRRSPRPAWGRYLVSAAWLSLSSSARPRASAANSSARSPYRRLRSPPSSRSSTARSAAAP